MEYVFPGNLTAFLDLVCLFPFYTPDSGVCVLAVVCQEMIVKCFRVTVSSLGRQVSRAGVHKGAAVFQR